jgi:hypothetical protein
MTNDPDTEKDAEEDDAIEQEEAAPLPTREVMSIVDPSAAAKLFPGEPIDPGMTTGQGVDERAIGGVPPDAS